MVEPWMYVESLIKNEVCCRLFCLNDCSIILCTNLSFVFNSMMIKVVWKNRCERVFNEGKSNTVQTNIIQNYKQTLKQFLLRERSRLKIRDFSNMYTFLCVIQEERLTYKF